MSGGRSTTVDEVESRMRDTVFVVQASTTERFFLWEKFHEGCDWQQRSPGYGLKYAEIEGKEATVSVTWDLIDGKLVMFWDLLSSIGDFNRAEAWLRERCAPRWDKGHRLAYTDAMNFHPRMLADAKPTKPGSIHN